MHSPIDTSPKNYYSSLLDSEHTEDIDCANYHIPSQIFKKHRTKFLEDSIENDLNVPSQALEDTSLNDIMDLLQKTMSGKVTGLDTTNEPPLSSSPSNVYSDSIGLSRMCINLIRHHFARSTDQTTLMLFKSFISTIQKVDPKLSILPINSTKQSFTALVSQKQIDSLTINQLCLYFTSWYHEQHYSLSDFFHLFTTLSLDEMLQKIPIAEWLDAYQCIIKLCRSQEEEMLLIGALCYGSIFLYCEDLLDLVIKPFHGSKESIEIQKIKEGRSTVSLTGYL